MRKGSSLISLLLIPLFAFFSPIAYAIKPNTWTSVGSMSVSHVYGAAVTLPDGNILLAGGVNGASNLNIAEIYNQKSETWSTTSSMNIVRPYAQAVLLPNGKVLVAGAASNAPYADTVTTELYDPATGLWSYTGNLNYGRNTFTLTLLQNGKVLLAGGYNGTGTIYNGNPTLVGFIKPAELYDPASGTWTVTGSLHYGRASHTATLLPDGRVLVTGGYNDQSQGVTPLTSAEIYDPASGTWSDAGSMTIPRYGHTATLLTNGNVLVTGGIDNLPNVQNGTGLVSTELYDPTSNQWSAGQNMNDGRTFHTATLLNNGEVLVTGGYNATAILSTAELYDPTVGTWSFVDNMSQPRLGHNAVLLDRGDVLVAGGGTTSEIFHPKHH